MFAQIARAFHSRPAADTAAPRRSGATAPADGLRQRLRVLCAAHGAELAGDAGWHSIRPARDGGLPVEIISDRGRYAVAFGDWVSDADTHDQILGLAEMALAGRLRLRIVARGRAREWTLERRQAGGAWSEISTMGVLGGVLGAGPAGGVSTTYWWNPPADVH